MNRRIARVVALSAAACALAFLAACGDNGSVQDDSSEESDTTAAAANGEASGSVPAACEILSSDDIQAAFGADPGATRPGGTGGRSVCFYDSGTIVGVQGANFWNTFAQAAPQNEGASCEEISGVGQSALFCVVMDSVGQFAWLDGDLMFDINANHTESSAFIELSQKVKI